MSEKREGYFKHTQHLVRMAGIFIAGGILFVIARALLVPEGFGMYGHYRPAAVTENMAKPVVYGGRAVCGECHDDVIQDKAGGAHENIGCEACHGPHAAHAADPSTVAGVKPEVSDLCHSCHEANVARPASFPQVRTDEHSEGEPCDSCHQPHFPL